MSYTLGLAIILAEDDTGLTLRGQLVDNSGANVGSAFTTGFAEIGSGCYHLAISIPDGHRGGIVIMDDADGSVLAYGSINPEQGENADAKTSTRGTADPGDAMDLVNAPNAAAIAAIQAGLAPAGEYDTELDAAVSSRSSHAAADVAALLNDLSSGDVETAVAAALADYLVATQGDLSGAVAGLATSLEIAALNNLSSADAEAAATAALTTYGPLTASQVEAAPPNFSNFALDESGRVDMGAVAGTAVTSPDDLKADVSALSTFDAANDEVNVGAVKGVAVAGVADFQATGFAVAGDAMALTETERSTLAGVIWNSLTSAFITVGSIGKHIVDYLDAAISGVAQPGDAMALTSDYDAAKTAAQAGDAMDLVDAPNATAVTALQTGLSTFDPLADGVTLAAEEITAIATAVGDMDVAGYEATASTSTTMGAMVAIIRAAIAGRFVVDNTTNTLTIYEVDAETPMAVYDLLPDGGPYAARTPQVGA